MRKNKLGESNILKAESLKFDEEEVRKLNDVLAEVRRNTDGAVHKQMFYKSLMGLSGYALRGITDEHRRYLAGEIGGLSPESDNLTRGSDIFRSAKSGRPLSERSGRRKAHN